MIGTVCFVFIWKQKQQYEQRKKEISENIYEVHIFRKSKEIMCHGIYDSGNLLTNQITNTGVCVIEKEQVKKLLCPKEAELVENFMQSKRKAKQLQNGIYTIKYFSIGQKEARMPGVLADQIIVSKNKEVLIKTNGMLGISPEQLSEKNKFSVLLPADIFERENYHNII